MKPLLLKLHRWIAIAVFLPLLVVVTTGGLLAIETILNDRHVTGKSIRLADVEAALGRYDPERKATVLNIRGYENSIAILAGRGAPPLRVDLATGERLAPGRGLWSEFFLTTRRLHEALLLDLKWLVDASTIVALAAMAVGLGMGWQRFRNTLGGWHRTTALLASPLLILSALSGLAIAYGWTFTGPPAATAGTPPVALPAAVRIVAAKHDLASVVWIRPQGSAMRARIYDGGRANVFTVTPAGLIAGPVNWPRIWHEGVWAGAWSGVLNLAIALVMTGLMLSGLTIWARRVLRRRPDR